MRPTCRPVKSPLVRTAEPLIHSAAPAGAVTEYRIRKRSRLKHKETRALIERLQAALPGVQLWPDAAAVEMGSLPEYDVILVDGKVHGLVLETQPFLSVRGLLAYRPSTRFVTVDMGAVRFLHNGADVMAPGIVEADAELQPGDWCWIRDERNKQPLGVGLCLQSGAQMVAGRKGKAVKSLHHIGDALWKVDA